MHSSVYLRTHVLICMTTRGHVLEVSSFPMWILGTELRFVRLGRQQALLPAEASGWLSTVVTVALF